MKNMKLRQVTVGDERLLFVWKNDPVTLANSRGHMPVAWEDHLAWFASAVSDPQKVMCIAEVEGVPVGLVRSGPNQSGQIEVCFTVDPKWRNQGVEQVMVELFVAGYVPDQNKVIFPIISGNTLAESVVAGLGSARLVTQGCEDQAVAEWKLVTTNTA